MTILSLSTLIGLFLFIVPSITIDPAMSPNLGDLKRSFTSAVPKISSFTSGAPEVKEEILGTAEVKDLFKSPKFGLIAGSIVIEGTIKRNKPIRVLRDNIVIFEGELDSLKRFKDDANEVPMGTECGIGVANYRDVKVGDKIEVYDRIEVKRTLN